MIFVFASGALLITSSLLLNACVCASLITNMPIKNQSLSLNNQQKCRDNQQKNTDNQQKDIDNHQKDTQNQPKNIDNQQKNSDNQHRAIGNQQRNIDNKQKETIIAIKAIEIKTTYFQDMATLFANVHFNLLLVSDVVFLFGGSVMYTHIMAYAESQGISSSLGRLMISLLGFSSIFGRIVLGLLSQHPKIDTVVLYIITVVTSGKICLLSNFCTMCFEDTYTCPILGPLVPLFWICSNFSKPQRVLPYLLMWRQMSYTLPEIHLWCYTFQPLDS